MHAASDAFLKGDIRMSKELDGLGCLGDMGWYNIRAALWVHDFELPQFVQACPGKPHPNQPDMVVIQSTHWLYSCKCLRLLCIKVANHACIIVCIIVSISIAGCIFTKADVPLYMAATLIWTEGRRGHFEVKKRPCLPCQNSMAEKLRIHSP